MLKYFALLLALPFVVSCGNSKGSDTAKAANALAAAFSGSSSRAAMIDRMHVELEKRAWIARFKAASNAHYDFTCDNFTGTGFCESGGTTMEDEDGTTVTTCTNTVNGQDCDIACNAEGKTFTVPCGAEKVKFTDTVLNATLKSPSCTDDGTTITVTYCMVFTTMTAKATFASLAGNALSCGNADGTQKMCSVMTVPKAFTETSTFKSSPGADSAMACTLDGETVTLDFGNGVCG